MAPRSIFSKVFRRKPSPERRKLGKQGAVRQKGEREFRVSIEGPKGGRQKLFARSENIAESRALINRFGSLRDVPRGTGIVVTDLRKKEKRRSISRPKDSASRPKSPAKKKQATNLDINPSKGEQAILFGLSFLGEG